ncbi:MAG: twin-arginine translocase subunit TatC [Elusimicrobia bacterium]|nr:twin-arginine translocase subunit TatC [Elusimicrobiota bacterium]
MSTVETAMTPELVDDPPMPFTDHLVELRRRLIQSLLIWGAGSALAFEYSDRFLDRLARPVGQLVFIAPAEAFHTRIKLALYGGLLLTLPLLLHQVWLFTARALDRRWRRRLLTMVPLAYGLFMGGVAVCLYAVVPAAMKFFLSYGSAGVRPLITLSAYLGFVETLSLAFGAVFQFPLVLYILNWMGILEKGQLTPYRRLIYFACFVFPALFTPDVVGQVCLAVSTIVLFELSLLAMGTAERP